MAATNNKNQKKLQYSDQSLQNALEAIKTGMKVAQASSLYKIPYQTLRDKLSGKSVNRKCHPGMESVLGPEIENRLVNWLQQCARQGFGVDKNRLLDSVQKIVTSNNLNTNFANNRPHNTWFYKFMKRHPELTQKRAEYINKARGSVTEQADVWFTGVTDILESDISILNDPKRIWNMDETGFQLSPKSPLVIGEKSRTLYNESARSNKESITTLFSVNALGTFAPPFTIFKYARIPQVVVDRSPSYWGLGKSDSGWMTASLFYEYIANVFLPFLVKENITLPVIIFLDGHASHLSLELSEFCSSHKIILIALFPNATHILQPLDVAVFGPMKAKWKQMCRQWRIDHDGTEINKQNIPEVLNGFIYGDGQMQANIISGFRCTGLFPFDANSVDYTKIVVRAGVCENENVTPTTEQEQFIQKVEANIDGDVLHRFKQCGESWNGNIEYKMLFLFWKTVCRPTLSIRGRVEGMTSESSLGRDTVSTINNNDNTCMGFGSSHSRFTFSTYENEAQSSDNNLVPNELNDAIEMTFDPSLDSECNNDNACMGFGSTHSRYTKNNISIFGNELQSSDGTGNPNVLNDAIEMSAEPSVVQVNLNDSTDCKNGNTCNNDCVFSPLTNVHQSFDENGLVIVSTNDRMDSRSEPSLVRDTVSTINTDNNAWMFSGDSYDRCTNNILSPLLNVQQSLDENGVLINNPIEIRSALSPIQGTADTVNTDDNAWILSVDSHDQYTSSQLNVPIVYKNNEQSSSSNPSNHQESTVHRQNVDKTLTGRSLVSIENLIQWPRSGKTDSKRKRDSLPSVLTSRQWQEIQKHKLAEKIKEEEAKAAKKQKKEDDKLQKEAEKLKKQEEKQKIRQKKVVIPKKGSAKRCR